MRILHILDHSIPQRSGYALRTLAILKEQRALGWETYHLTGPAQGRVASDHEQVDGWDFYRTLPPGGILEGLPVIGDIELMGEIAHRIERLVKRIRPHVLHAHSPVLTAIPALRVGHRLDLPVVYEVRALCEDTAVTRGAARKGGLRYRCIRGLETWVFRRVDAITTTREALRADIVGRGIPAHKVTVVPDAADSSQAAGDDNPGLSWAASVARYAEVYGRLTQQAAFA